MLAVYLFNLTGYSLLFRLLINHSNKQAATVINKGIYSDDELLHIKIPVLLPYSTSWSDYERYDGEVEYKGIYYKYVKRKIYNDTLHLLCLPDFKRTRLQSAESNYARQVNNVGASSNERTTSLAKKNTPASEYEQPKFSYALSPIILSLPSFPVFFSVFLSDADRDSLIQPPDNIV